MLCKDFKENLETFIAGQLPGGESALLTAHLESCSDCARLHAERLEMRRKLREVLDTPAPPDLKEAIRSTSAGHESIIEDEDWDDDFTGEEWEDQIDGCSIVTTAAVSELGRDEIAAGSGEMVGFARLKRVLPYVVALLLIAVALVTGIDRSTPYPLKHGIRVEPPIYHESDFDGGETEFGGLEFEGSIMTGTPIDAQIKRED
ncbi:MAG: hypothetical protein GY835_16040 [bacterium]|nr:hypothetical protein [bacterium]